MTSTTERYELLVAFAAGELTGAKAAEAAALVARDPEAAAALEQLRVIIRTLQTDDSVAAPDEVVARARAIFRARSRPARIRPEGLLAGMKRVIATLVFDSRAQLPVAGLRGSGRAYQLSFESAVADVDLEVEQQSAGKGVRIRGQVAVRDRGRVESVGLAPPNGSTTAVETTPDTHGMFNLTAGLGTYDVVVALEDTVLILPNLEFT